MTDWSPLGGNPAPGDPEGIRMLAQSFGASGTELASVALTVSQLPATWESGWMGEAGSRFTIWMDGVPEEIANLRQAHETAGQALFNFADDLELAQADAVKALSNAVQAIEDSAAAGDQLGDLVETIGSVTAQLADNEAHQLELHVQVRAEEVASGLGMGSGPSQQQLDDLQSDHDDLSEKLDQLNSQASALRTQIADAADDLNAARRAAQSAAEVLAGAAEEAARLLINATGFTTITRTFVRGSESWEAGFGRDLDRVISRAHCDTRQWARDATHDIEKYALPALKHISQLSGDASVVLFVAAGACALCGLEPAAAVLFAGVDIAQDINAASNATSLALRLVVRYGGEGGQDGSDHALFWSAVDTGLTLPGLKAPGEIYQDGEATAEHITSIEGVGNRFRRLVGGDDTVKLYNYLKTQAPEELDETTTSLDQAAQGLSDYLSGGSADNLVQGVGDAVRTAGTGATDLAVHVINVTDEVGGYASLTQDVANQLTGKANMFSFVPPNWRQYVTRAVTGPIVLVDPPAAILPS